ncbi:MAG TPA: lysophospholipid acyltransferase family protein [Chloroflexota bacterium]|nr:lysophospholipid acyltransferase family protein [Chloroflexota bacterium]
MLYRFLFPIVNWLVRVVAYVTVSGVENMPRSGGVLLVSNHLTNLDPLIIGMCFKRELHFMAKTELFKNPLLARVITALNAFPVRRGEPDRGALRQAEALLHGGRVVAIFPEGHRSRHNGVQESRGGIALLARRAGVPILPVAITGTQHLRPRALLRWRPWRRPHITVTVGAPFTLPHPDGRPDYSALAGVIMRHVAELLPSAYRGVFGE